MPITELPPDPKVTKSQLGIEAGVTGNESRHGSETRLRNLAPDMKVSPKSSEGIMLEQARQILSRLSKENFQDNISVIMTELENWAQDVEDQESKFLKTLVAIWTLKERFPSLLDRVRETVGEDILEGVDSDTDISLTGLWRPIK